MDKLKLLINGIDNYNIVGTITNEGEYRSCCRTLDFTILKSKAKIKVGDTVTFKVGEKVQFMGIVTSKNVSTDDEMINISCKDYGIYLKKNSGVYKFRDATPKSIVERICKDFNIPLGNILNINTKITRNFINVNLYNILATAYTLNSDKKITIQFIEGKLTISERGEVAKRHILKDNLISVDATESIDDMVNTVNIYNDKDQLIKTIQNESDRKLFGQFNDLVKVTEGKDYIADANKKLKSTEQKISVGNLGDSSYTTGMAVIVETPINSIKGKYHIDSDTHKWQNGIYTNKLTLNFKMVMDEKEDGSIEQSKNYKKADAVKKASKKKGTKKATTKKGKEDYSKYTDKLK